MVGAVVGLKKVSLPAFIFIDELDRCRPSYAVEMLETIKHIFDIEGVVFVVATDTEQLQHAVKAVYGEGFDARVYLSRFFNSRFSLKEPKLNKLLNVHCESHKLSSDYLDDKCIVTFPLREDGNRVLENIAELVSVFGHTPRTAIQVAERVIATISNMPMHTNVDILLLTFLLSLKEKDHELYNEVVTGSFDRREEGKTLSLIDYLDKQYLISSQERYLHFHLEPLLITENISDGRRYNIANPYPVDVYSISVYSYLSDIVMPQLEQSSNDINIWLVSNESEPEQKPLEKVSRRLIDYYYSKKNVSLYHRNPEVTAMWIEYLYLHYEYDFSSVSVEKYRELVDFASALDWLYLHEGSEVS
ncbi:putative phage protein [Vibrio maritimus]|uniref:Putative phage protein n=1 Tax=Vibrio maritimus TaxID=990268 RepID=A0A090S7P7_9VIBR|nr:putative phage protein [Vibrio maritimus]